MPLLRLVLWCCCALLAPGLAAQPQKVEVAGKQFTVDRPPSWIKPRAVPPAPASGSGKTVDYLLADHQILAASSGTERYFRLVMIPTERAGLEQVSQIEILFDPEYETLVVHDISVLRGGVRIDKLNTKDVKLVQRERELERQVYDGVVSAFFLLTDIRVGDRIEYSYTVKGDNPALGNKIAQAVTLGFSTPVAAIHVRVRYPADRRIQYRFHGTTPVTPEATEDGNHRELAWRFARTAVVLDEDDVPGWHPHYPWLQFSEYADWNEVARWASGLFGGAATAKQLPPELEKRVAAWRKLGTPAERARAALDFVQHEVRYFAVSLGESSHKPNPPDVVMQRRYGDCKDKAALLAAILRRLDIDAAPALVSLRMQRGVQRMLPSPRVFDHVIVRANIDGQTYWLDGTRSHQNGGLAMRSQPYATSALVVLGDTQTLAAVAPSPGYRNAVHVEEVIHIADFGQAPQLTINTTYWGDEAERVRASFARSDLAQVEQRAHDYHLRRYPRATRVGQLSITDEPERGSLSVRETYSIPGFLEYDDLVLRGRMEAWVLNEYVRLPKVGMRKAPLLQAYPIEVMHRLVVQLPDNRDFKPGDSFNVDDAALAYLQSRDYRDGRLVVRHELRTRADAVSVQDMENHLRNRRKIYDNLVSSFNLSILSDWELASARREFRPVRNPRTASTDEVADEIASRQRVRTRMLDQIIASSRLSGENLARAYADRALSLSYQDLTAEAIRNIDKAIELDASSGRAHLVRGELRNRTGEFARALADFDQAEQLNADRQRLYFSRGQALYYLGRYDDAALDFERSLEQATAAEAPFRLLWLQWANAKAGRKGEDVLAAHMDRVKSDRWPGPALQLMQGKRTPEEVLRAARDEDKRLEVPQLCEAYFYIGQYYLLAGDTARAQGMFEQSVRTNVRMYIEHGFARAELDRISRQRSK